MEEVLDTYQRDFAENEVLVCMDETRRQQTKETRLPRPVRPGQPEIVDYEYERNGTAHLFLAFAPNENWRTVVSTPPPTDDESFFLTGSDPALFRAPFTRLRPRTGCTGSV